VAAEDWLDFGYDEWDEREERRMSWAPRTDNFVVFNDVKFLKSATRAILCRFKEGNERWVPFSQMPDGFNPEEGTEGDLEVTEWFADRLDEEDGEKEDDVAVPDVTVLRESDKALQVRVGRGEPIWIPKTQIREASPVQHDGERGVLLISAWIAEQKGLSGSAVAPPAERANVGSQVRSQGKPAARQEKDERQESLAYRPGDDDIPF